MCIRDRYTVRASMTGYDTNETTLTVSAPGTIVRDFELAPSAVEDEGGGLSAIAIAGIAAAVIIIIGIAAFALMKRKKSEQPPPAP